MTSLIVEDQDTEPVALNIRTMPRFLRNQFKAYCADLGISMEQGVVELIMDTVLANRRENIERNQIAANPDLRAV